MSLHSYNGLADLWIEAFDDDPTGVSLFFDLMSKPENTLVKKVDDKPISAVYLVDIMLSNGKEPIDAFYFCGAATKEEYRGKGYISELIEQAKKTAVEKGKKYIALIPANDGLYDFYAQRGFTTFFYADDKRFIPDGTGHSDFLFKELSDVTAMQILQNSESLKRPYSVMKTAGIFTYTFGEAALCGGRIYAVIKNGDIVGYLAYYPDENLIHEVMCPNYRPDDVINGFVNVFGLSETFAVLPAENKNGRKKGMLWSADGVIPDTEKPPFINLLLEER